MDIFAQIYSTLKYSIEIYNSLFQASIALAGFIAIFIVFSYQTIDNRVDHRKDILRSLLCDQIKKVPYIAVRIQNIGTDPGAQDANALCGRINKDLIDEKEKILDPKTKKAVKELAGDIHGYRRLRNLIVYFGITSIFIWSILSLKYLFVLAVSSCLFNRICCSEIVVWISIVLFTLSMLLTLIFIIISLIAKAKWFNAERQ